MASVSQWISGARPQTLPLAISPVVIGSVAAYDLDQFHLGFAGLALAVAILMQVGANYANDYSDGVRGTDDQRIGPRRLTAARLATPSRVKAAAIISFSIAVILGAVLVVLSESWPLALVGVACVIAAWGYTGGKNPYGYMGLGDLFVFIFFGLVAVLGTQYTQASQLSVVGWIGAVSCGLIASALLMANNIRDIPTDQAVGKKTMAVRLGDASARRAFVLMIATSMALPILLVGTHPWIISVLLLIPFSLVPCWVVLKAPDAKSLIPALRQTGLFSLLFAVLFAVGIILTKALS